MLPSRTKSKYTIFHDFFHCIPFGKRAVLFLLLHFFALQFLRDFFGGREVIGHFLPLFSSVCQF